MSDIYVGTMPCGCVVAASVIDGRERQAAKDAYDYLARGYTVERRNGIKCVEVELGRCPHEIAADDKVM